MMYKILNQMQKCNTNIRLYNNIHEYSTRAHNRIYQEQVVTNIGLNNPIVRAGKVFNQLPQDIKSIQTICKFVKEIKGYLSML